MQMAWLLNIILPGTGLIVRRRQWLGMLLAMVFAICGNVAIAGTLIAPLAIPSWLGYLAIGIGAASWLLSQYLFYAQGIILSRIARGLAHLLADARHAMTINDLDSACRALDGGLALDEENAELHALRARLFLMKGDHPAMLTEWGLVIRYDHTRQYIHEASEAIQAHGNQQSKTENRAPCEP